MKTCVNVQGNIFVKLLGTEGSMLILKCAVTVRPSQQDIM